MRSISPDNQAALAARCLYPRDFLWIVARDRVSGEPVSVGFWSDLSNVSALVIDPETGVAQLRDWYGAGAMISISDIPAVASVAVQKVTIRMSQLDEMVEQAVRRYDVKQARVEIFTGLLDPKSRKLVAPADAVFIGFIDRIEIVTPAENEDGAITITCISHTQEMLRSNPAVRSHEDQRLRDLNDDFFIDAGVCGDWEHYWGAVKGKTETVQPARQGLFGWGNFLGFL